MNDESMTRETGARERLIELLRIALTSDAPSGETPPQGEHPTFPPLSEKEEERLYRIAKEQDLAHLILPSAEQAGIVISPPYQEKYQKQTFLALYRDERMTHTLARVCDALSAAKIAHIPLKGAVMRALYPASWQRTSCDLDILVREEELDAAVAALEAVGFRCGKRIFHDVHMTTDDGFLLELHFSLAEDSPTLDPVLARVWEHSAPESEGSYCYRMTPSFFLFHLLAHMSYHFSAGGCGVRPFMDIYLYRRAVEADREELSALLSEASLTKFADGAFRLSEVWFSDAPADDLCRDMESFLFGGGVYGTKQQSMAVNRAKKGGRVAFVFRRLFPPLRTLALRYPTLKKCPFLLPFFWVWRWLETLFGKEARRRNLHLLKIMNDVDGETVDRTKDLLENLGL